MKKTISFFLALTLVFALTLPAIAADTDEWKETDTFESDGSELVETTGAIKSDFLLCDYAEILTEEEQAEVLEVLVREGEKVGCSFVVLTEDYVDEENIWDYAENWYLSHDYENNGALLVVSMDDRNAQIVAHGTCKTVINSEAGIDYLFDLFISDMKADNWAEAFKGFAIGARQMMQENAETGRVWKKPYNKIWILISIGAGLLVAAIVTGNMKSKLKSVHFQNAAANYVVPGTLNLTNANDVYLYSSVTRTPRPKDTGSSSRSSGSSGSSGGSRHF